MNRLYILTAITLFFSACTKKTRFQKIDAAQSGIYFNNKIDDNDTLNILDIENIYNGGGVGIADFNGDGLQDIYFTGNTVSNKLYLNKGNFKFDDITEIAGVSGAGKWSRGVSVVDINNDGLQDIYVCATIWDDSVKRENLLYINTGNNAHGIPVFKELAKEYGLHDNSHSTMAAFFDYDNDGDLDMYLVVNKIAKTEFPNKFRPKFLKGEHPNTDKLFQNNWNTALQHPVFTNISAQAGITVEGYGHGVNICDINNDGWKDIYVTNDFLPDNILYINNKNGTFTDRVKAYFKHTSSNAMGQDVIDINNDGLVDVIELDMNPEDNYRKKMMMNPIGYQNFQFSDMYGYQYQYVRNSLQLNQGNSILENDSVDHPVFSDIGFYAGIEATDWSWAPVVADFDNDGYRDIIITNGFPKDVTDHDFIAFRSKAMSLTSKRELLDDIPQVKIANYAYKNNGNLTFSNATNEWGFETPSFSNGAAWADLDNDGDLDIVINNINDEAFLYKNNTDKAAGTQKNNYLNIYCKAATAAINSTGAVIELHYANGKKQVYENTPYRGYLSSMQSIAHFGLGTTAMADTVLIKWPNGKYEYLFNVQANQTITVTGSNSKLPQLKPGGLHNALFTDVTGLAGVKYVQSDSEFIDFDIQRLLPHKLSEYGPALAAGDIDGNGLDDIVCGGALFYNTQILLQQTDGRFFQKPLQGNIEAPSQKKSEDAGIVLFDADNDGDNDIYIASGSYERKSDTESYTDHFFINKGGGNFDESLHALPVNMSSKAGVKAADYDNDGDLDLFLAGRVLPGNYPKPVSSFIYRNDTKNGKVVFTDVTNTVAKSLNNAGMVCDAVFTDFDNDGWTDLILAGEWMPLKFLKNSNGIFNDVTAATGLQMYTGWWNSLLPADVDNDGDMDYIAGNTGANSYYRASQKQPVYITANDFDANGSYDALMSSYLPASAKDKKVNEYTAHLRDDYASQLNSIKKKYLTYNLFANATATQLLEGYNTTNLLRLNATWLKSAVIKNEGQGKFSIAELPAQAQFSSVYGMAADDFDADGNIDVVINGNDYGTEVSIGRYDALNGLFLKGDGKGNFTPLSILQSGIYIPGNGKALVMLQSAAGKCLIAASENKGPLKLLQLKNSDSCIRFLPADVSAVIKYKNGKVQRRDINYGHSFFSQSARFILFNKNMASMEVTDNKGQKRLIVF